MLTMRSYWSFLPFFPFFPFPFPAPAWRDVGAFPPAAPPPLLGTWGWRGGPCLFWNGLREKKKENMPNGQRPICMLCGWARWRGEEKEAFSGWDSPPRIFIEHGLRATSERASYILNLLRLAAATESKRYFSSPCVYWSDLVFSQKWVDD